MAVPSPSNAAVPALSSSRGVMAPALSGFLPVLLLLFIGSGCSALIYEIVWFQLLEFVIGSSAVSIGVLLGTFMGGMCLGSLLFSRLVPRRFHPLRVYALLELAIGILAVLLTRVMPLFDHLYIAIAHPGAGAVTLRALVCALCLLPPTLLMGATLPAISRWIETTPKGVAWLGFFYGGNTAGAVFGCLIAGFYLLPNFDLTTATYFAAVINVIVALAGLGLSMIPRDVGSTKPVPAHVPPAAPTSSSAGVISIHLAIAFSGMAALGAEVVWTRLLSLLLGGTVYTFSIILAVFLVGLFIGSSVGAMLARSGVNARLALAWCQVLCALGIGWTAYSITNGLPNWPIDPGSAIDPHFGFQLDLARCFWAILPPTIFWGASFPLALAAVAAAGDPRKGETSRGDPARLVGRVYAANTVGAIFGALLFSLIFIPRLGTQGSEHVLIAIAGISALLAIIPGLFQLGDPDVHHELPGTIFSLVLAAIIPATSIFVLYGYGLDEVPWQLVAWGRRIQVEAPERGKPDLTTKVYMGEGMNSSVAVTDYAGTSLRFHVSGKVEASTLPEDMRLQLMLGHFPALMHHEPKSVLIVGCGAGVTAGTFILHPDVKRIVICELEPLIPQVVARYFGRENNDVVLRDANGKLVSNKVEIVYDDARHFILTTHEKFDIITSDPIHPWVKGAATLYTKEYFDLVKAHLNPGGLVTQWIPLYESSEPAVKSEIATFCETFPNAILWSNDTGGAGYDAVIMGGADEVKINAEELQAKLDKNIMIGTTLADANFKNAVDMVKTYAGRAADLGPWMADAAINHDSNLRLAYLAGEALNQDQASQILNHILRYRKYPESILTASPAQRAALQQVWSGVPPAEITKHSASPTATQPSTTMP